jgi:hypothetical protein
VWCRSSFHPFIIILVSVVSEVSGFLSPFLATFHPF